MKFANAELLMKWQE